MSSDLQRLVDALGASLRRPVCVDDSRFRLLAYKEHELGEVDDVRLAKLLHREADADVQAWLEEHGARTADHYARIPRNPELGMAARILIPLRFEGLLLGWLALIDEPTPISDAELGEALRYSRELAVSVYQASRLQPEERRPEVAIVRELLGLAADATSVSDDEITARGFLAVTPGYACIVARAFTDTDGPLPASARVGIAALMEWARRIVPAHHVISITAGDEAIAVLAVAKAADIDVMADALKARLGQRMDQGMEVKAVIGVGGIVPTVAKLKTSLEQARCAADVARRVEAHAPLARWSTLGSYRTVSNLLANRPATAEVLPTPVRRLLEHADAETLLSTLEAYLDHGGDAAATACALYVHRSSLYPRLKRIENIAGVKLSSGDARLQMHLGLRLWRLSKPQTA